MDMTTRIERIEAQLAIQQLAVRYARAADMRDVDGLTALFAPGTDFGAWGHDRDQLHRFFDRVLRRFYRSMHQVVGHVIDIEDADTARGTVYCRAEHEDGPRWVIMAICYEDHYRRVDGEWYFRSRRVDHWYTCDVLERPHGPSFQSWPGHEDHVPALPHRFVTWEPFWREAPELVDELTAWP
jgi:SnoaL-like domain